MIHEKKITSSLCFCFLFTLSLLIIPLSKLLTWIYCLDFSHNLSVHLTKIKVKLVPASSYNLIKLLYVISKKLPFIGFVKISSNTSQTYSLSKFQQTALDFYTLIRDKGFLWSKTIGRAVSLEALKTTLYMNTQHFFFKLGRSIETKRWIIWRLQFFKFDNQVASSLPCSVFYFSGSVFEWVRTGWKKLPWAGV